MTDLEQFKSMLDKFGIQYRQFYNKDYSVTLQVWGDNIDWVEFDFNQDESKIITTYKPTP